MQLHYFALKAQWAILMTLRDKSLCCDTTWREGRGSIEGAKRGAPHELRRAPPLAAGCRHGRDHVILW